MNKFRSDSDTSDLFCPKRTTQSDWLKTLIMSKVTALARSFMK